MKRKILLLLFTLVLVLLAIRFHKDIIIYHLGYIIENRIEQKKVFDFRAIEYGNFIINVETSNIENYYHDSNNANIIKKRYWVGKDSSGIDSFSILFFSESGKVVALDGFFEDKIVIIFAINLIDEP